MKRQIPLSLTKQRMAFDEAFLSKKCKGDHRKNHVEKLSANIGKFALYFVSNVSE
jgi:hypothetical protein